MINFSTKQKKRGSCFTAHTSPPNVAIDEYGESRRSVEFFFLVCLFVGSLTKAPRGGNVLFTIDRVLYTFFFKIKIFSFSVLDRCRLIRPCFFLFCFLIIFGTAPWRNSTVFFVCFWVPVFLWGVVFSFLALRPWPRSSTKKFAYGDSIGRGTPRIGPPAANRSPPGANASDWPVRSQSNNGKTMTVSLDLAGHSIVFFFP